MSAQAVEITIPPSAFNYEISTIHLAGSFNEWAPDTHEFEFTGEQYTINVPLKDGAHQYKLVITPADGTPDKWELDPVRPVYAPDGLGGYNSAMIVKADEMITPPQKIFELFEWNDPEVESVSVAGDFDKWEPGYLNLRKGEDGTWRAHIFLKRPFAYKYVVDGDWLVELPKEGVLIQEDENGFDNNFRPLPGEEPVAIIEARKRTGRAITNTPISNEPKPNADSLNESVNAANQSTSPTSDQDTPVTP